jgi:hypothetical protein
MEGREILDRLLENSSFPTDHNEPRRQESESSHERPSTAKSKFSPFASQDSAIEPSLEPRTPKEEEIQPSEFSSRFEDDPSRNIRSTLNHYRHEKLMTLLCLCETLDEDFHHTTTVDWLKEVKRTSKAIQISSTSTTIPCAMKGNVIEYLHDSTVEACI